MKSAIGIGALLMDGLGDTIRVSLTGNEWGLTVGLRKEGGTGRGEEEPGNVPLFMSAVKVAVLVARAPPGGRVE